MAQRITQRDLQAVVDRINRMMGAPAEPYAKIGDKYVPQIGCYHLDGAYGGYALHRMVSETGGVSDVLGFGHRPKRDLYRSMYAFIRGIEEARERPQC
jgi:hypothetical protein